MSRIVLQITALILLAGAGNALAQGRPASSTAGTPAQDTLPVRIELGGYNYWVDQGFGDWRGLDAELWFRGNKRFVPAFLFDSQTRPTGTQQNYTFMSYLNWTNTFYTVQSVSGAPQRSDQAIYFPKFRYDIKGYWKLPPTGTRVRRALRTISTPWQREIYNLARCIITALVVEGNLFINQSHPGGPEAWAACPCNTDGRKILVR
jgi:hypothetical protein